mmetsp:Transcript_10411/g.26954  ORF Transcript_10411/g.26954 Transcript_10411/m.26954 type:complete len:281 (-) Transcript_10411:84-926(-)
MGWTSEVQLHIRAPARITRRVRRRFTHKGFQNFTSGHRGLIGMDAPDEHAEAHAMFSAHAMEHVDEAQLALLSGLTAEILDAGGVGAELAAKIAALASECYGELIYEFSIWKDNVTEVADRILQVLDRAMVDEFGTRWRDLKLPSATLFIHAYADLGHGDVSRFDLTPTLKRRSRVSYDLFLDGGEEQEDAGPIDTGRFESFTEELMAAHVTCEPEAFGCYEGGRGTTVRINGLQAKPELNGLSAKILGPVDLESGRWPVELLDGRRNLSVRGQNLVAGS